MTAPFAILAPVPIEHLESGRKIAAAEPYVAYGTMKFELMAKIEKDRQGERVQMLIYPSHEDKAASNGMKVSWFGWFDGFEISQKNGHSGGKRYRPASTFEPPHADGAWAVYWHVAGLRELPAELQIPIGKIQGFKGGWRKQAPPRGPELVTPPSLYDHMT